MRRLLGIVARLVQVTAWLIFLGALALLVVEESGALAEATRAGLAWRLGPLGEGLEVQRVRLRWFEPGIELHRVRLSDPGSGRELLYLHRVHFSADLNLKDRPLRRLHVAGGRTRISDDLFAAIDQISDRWAAQESPSTPFEFKPPPLLVTDFDVDLELPGGDVLELGTVDLLAHPIAADRFRLAGRVLPSLSGAIEAGTPVNMSGRLDPAGLEVRINSRDLRASTAGFRVPASMGSLPVEEFAGSLDVTAGGHLRFGEPFEASAHVRARMHQARLQPRAGDPWVENLQVDVDVEATYRPEVNRDIWAREIWRATSQARADWNGTPVEIWTQLGREVPPGAWARCLARAPRLPLGDHTMEALGLEDYGKDLRRALGPRGEVDASLDLLLGRDFETRGWALRAERFSALLRHVGSSGITFHGFSDPIAGERLGLDIPLEGIRGATTITYDPALADPLRLVMTDVTGELPSGGAAGWAGITTNPDPQSPAFDLEVSLRVPATELSPEMERALRESALTREIWRDFDPRGGRVATDWRLVQNESTKGLTGMGDVIVEGASMRWADLPVPMHDVRGDVRVRWADRSTRGRVPLTIPLLVPTADGGVLPHVTVLPGGFRALGVYFSFRNDGPEPHPGLTARVEGYVREESLPQGHEPADREREPLHELSIEIEDVGLRGPDWEILTRAYPDIEQRRKELEANGAFQLRLGGHQASHDGPYLLDVEAEGRSIELTPEVFPHRTQSVRGRLLTRFDLDGELSDSRFAVAGEWPQGAEIGAVGRIPPQGLSTLEAHAAGVDTNNLAVRGALQAALNAEREAEEPRVDMREVALHGQVDVQVRSRFDADDEERESEDAYSLFLRSSTLEVEDLRLERLNGELEWEGTTWRSRRVDAELGGHPVRVEDVLMFTLEDAPLVADVDPLLRRGGYLDRAGGLAIQGRMSTENLPLDEEHLSHLMDEETLAPLREHEDWSGQIDLLRTNLLVTSTPDNLGQVFLYGPLRVHDMHVPSAFPLAVLGADVELIEFVLEQGKIRAWGSVEDLTAEFLERRLEDARMMFSFVDGRLTVDNLSGAFEDGRLESLGAGALGARKAVGVDTSEPYRFDLAIRFQDLDVGRLMRGVFESSIADTGRLSGTLQLAGTPGEVLGLRGRGEIDLSEGRLWSIPAARELFSQLGFPNTGVFNRLQARFEVSDGQLLTHDMRVRSSLLQLVGTGVMDFSGQLSYDLDVRYSILDKLGILNRVLYWLNRNLWRVAVRGDFQRPLVLIRSGFLELLMGSRDDPRRPLPLPDFSPLGPRF